MPRWTLLFGVLFLTAACTATPAATPTATKPPAAATAAKPAAEATKPAAATPTAAPKPAAAAPTAAPKPAVKPLDPAVTIKIGQTGNIAEAILNIGEAKGYVAAEGLKLEFVRFQSATQMVAPLGTGELDVGGGTPSPGLYNAIARGVPIKVVADRATAFPGQAASALMVRKDLIDGGQVKQYADLKGKTVALPSLGNSLEIDLEKFLAAGGLKLTDVNIVTMGFPDMVTAISSKGIDAAVGVEPFVAQAVDKGVAVRWKGEDEIYPNHQTSVLLYGPNFYQSKPEAAKRLMVVYLRGVRDYLDAFTKNVNKEQIRSVLIEATTIKDPALYDKMAVNGMNPDGYVNVQSMASDQDWYIAKNYQQQKLDLSTVVDNQYVDYALERLGKYKR